MRFIEAAAGEERLTRGSSSLPTAPSAMSGLVVMATALACNWVVDADAYSVSRSDDPQPACKLGFDDRAVRDLGFPQDKPLPPPARVTDADLPAELPCDALPNPVYIAGGNALVPVIGRVAQRLAAELEPTTVIFWRTSACEGLNLLIDHEVIQGSAVYWKKDTSMDPTAEGSSQRCMVPPGTRPDIATAAAFATSCPRPFPNGLPSHVRDVHGPVEAISFVVPARSRQRMISAKAARAVFGFGSEAGVEPWTDEGYLWQRGAYGGGQAQVAATIGLDSHLWRGNLVASTQDLLIAMARSNFDDGIANRTLGLTPHSNLADLNTALQVRELAFQGPGQTCAVWPSSTPTSGDLMNVRTGEYRLWGPYHFFVRDPPRREAQRVIAAVTGSDERLDLDIVKLYAALRLVPQCAMRFERSSDGDLPVPIRKTGRPCHCYFDWLTTGRTSCRDCEDTPTACDGATICRDYGQAKFCEAR